MLFSFIISFIVEGKILSTLIIIIFFLILVYGYFFNKSTEKIIETNFHLTKNKRKVRSIKAGTKKAKKGRTRKIKNYLRMRGSRKN